MKFKVHHITKLFYQYRDWFLLAPFGLFILFIAFGFTIDDYIPTLIVFGLISLCIVIFLLMLILHIIEIVTGAKIIIGNDHVEIRRLLRLRRKIPFTEIEEVRYTHEMIPVHTHRGGRGRVRRRRTRYAVRPQLAFFLTSGKCICLNDSPGSYLTERERAKVDPSVDPDTDITLYQAYQCYRAAVDEYSRQQGLQIPR